MVYAFIPTCLTLNIGIVVSCGSPRILFGKSCNNWNPSFEYSTRPRFRGSSERIITLKEGRDHNIWGVKLKYIYI